MHRLRSLIPWLVAGLIAAMALALAGCGTDDGPDAGEAEGTTTLAAPDGVLLQLESADTGRVAGTVRLRPAGARATQVRVRLASPPEGRVSVDVHRGTCADVEDFNAAYPLGSTEGREIVTEIPARLATLQATPHAVDVHPMGEPIDMLACVDIPQREL